MRNSSDTSSLLPLRAKRAAALPLVVRGPNSCFNRGARGMFRLAGNKVERSHTGHIRIASASRDLAELFLQGHCPLYLLYYTLLVGAVLVQFSPLFFLSALRTCRMRKRKVRSSARALGWPFSVQQGVRCCDGPIRIWSRSLTFFAPRPFTSLMARLMACPARVEKPGRG